MTDPTFWDELRNEVDNGGSINLRPFDPTRYATEVLGIQGITTKLSPQPETSLTAAEAVAILNVLSERFNITPPSFRFNRSARRLWRGGRGLYFPRTRTVTIGKRYCGRSTATDSLLHEFAHHLADEWCRKTWINPERRTYAAEESLPHHDDRFKRALWQVVLAYYGDATKYCWDREYTKVKWWAAKRMKEEQPALVLDAIPARAVAERKPSYPPFDEGAVVAMWGRGYHSISGIARQLNGGRKLGHTRNLVRAALRKAGVYKEPL